MVLWVIGLGLGDEKDITVKGLEAVKSSEHVYLEAYTSLLGVEKEKLEAFYGKKITIADREYVENDVDDMLEKAKASIVSFLVVGDPFGATTHSDLVLRAKEKEIEVKVVHNASIMNAIGCCGLQLYRFGQTVSLVFFTETWRPDSFYDRVKSNRTAGLHTLCLLDIKVREPTMESLARGKKVYEAPRFMTINQALQQLLEVEEKRKEGVYSEDTFCIGVARVGQDSQAIISGTLKELLNVDFGAPLHSLVICGELHHIEEEMFNTFKATPAQQQQQQHR